MPMLNDDMSKVEKWGDLLPEGVYHLRVEKTEIRESSETPGAKVLWIWGKVQNEPHVGRLLMDNCSLQSHALAKLKAYYEAVGYTPGPGGHDPDNLVDKEVVVKYTHQIYQSEKRGEVKPFNIKSVTEASVLSR